MKRVKRSERDLGELHSCTVPMSDKHWTRPLRPGLDTLRAVSRVGEGLDCRLQTAVSICGFDGLQDFVRPDSRLRDQERSI